MENNDSNENNNKTNETLKINEKKNYILNIEDYNIEIINNGEDIEESKKEVIYKVIIIGDQGVGKTSIIQNLTEKGIDKKYKATIGFDIFHYSAKVKDIIIKLQIWDTCGLEEFHSCTPNLYKNTLFAIVVYEINNKNSFENADRWINLLKKNSQPETLIFLVGNKNDLENEREVSRDEGTKFVEDNNLNYFIETSAKENKYVDELFNQGLAQLYELNKKYENNKEKDEDEERIDFSKRKGSFRVEIERKQSQKKNNNCC